MADEIPPNVYDILHPTPVSLKQLSSIALSLEVWRREINLHRLNRTLNGLRFSSASSPQRSLRSIPPEISALIEKYVKKFALSLEHWVKVQFRRISNYQENEILNLFDDFVCDHDGAIHYVRTAGRMMRSDQVSDTVKFKIACMYCFEDDIRRLWPSVRENNDFNREPINFYDLPQLYYWICDLRNQLSEVNLRRNDPVDEVMFDVCLYYCGKRSSTEYFWNRIPSENRLRKAIDLFERHQVYFIEFILPKLDDQQIVEFLNQKGYRLMYTLLNNPDNNDELILATWKYIKNKMNENEFTNLVVELLRIEAIGTSILYRSAYVRKPPSWSHLSCEIWNSTPYDLKQAAITTVISMNNKLFKNILDANVSKPRNVQFLFAVLSYAAFEERSKFWHKCWHQLIVNIRISDLQRFLELCFETEAEISEFKEFVMVDSVDFRKHCFSLLTNKSARQFDDLVEFCCPDAQAARYFKQKVRQLVFTDEDRQLYSL